MIFSEHIYLDCRRSKIKWRIKKTFVLSISELDTFVFLSSGGCPGEQPGWYNLWARLILDRLEFLKKEIKKWSESNGGLDLHVYQIRYYSFNFVKMKSKFCKIMTFIKKTHLHKIYHSLSMFCEIILNNAPLWSSSMASRIICTQHSWLPLKSHISLRLLKEGVISFWK